MRKRKGKVIKNPEPLPEPDTYNCLLRAKCDKTAISTVVSEIGIFFQYFPI